MQQDIVEIKNLRDELHGVIMEAIQAVVNKQSKQFIELTKGNTREIGYKSGMIRCKMDGVNSLGIKFNASKKAFDTDYEILKKDGVFTEKFFKFNDIFDAEIRSLLGVLSDNKEDAFFKRISSLRKDYDDKIQSLRKASICSNP